MYDYDNYDVLRTDYHDFKYLASYTEFIKQSTVYCFLDDWTFFSGKNLQDCVQRWQGAVLCGEVQCCGFNECLWICADAPD